jgi:ribbon-helix-helix CopG family protein
MLSMGIQKVKGKGLKGVPRTEHEEKKKVMTLSLTPTAIAALDRIASALRISRSELIERLARADDAAIMELLKGKSQY